jgi:hypothetical protein
MIQAQMMHKPQALEWNRHERHMWNDTCEALFVYALVTYNIGQTQATI